jgi:7 transmembrane helices usually fused to an inactive transglutaminase
MPSMKRLLLPLIAVFFILSLQCAQPAHAQSNLNMNQISITTTTTPSATPSATPTPNPKDITRPEKEQSSELTTLFKNRDASKLTLTNFIAYGVQYSVKQGVPSSTIILILLLPFLATIVVFFRYIIGLTGLGLLVPIALSITLLDTGLLAGLILLTTIIATSYLARIFLKRIRIMQLPKLALSMWLVAIAIVVVLTIAAIKDTISVQDISIFPILLLVLLSDRVVALFLERSMREVIQITLITLLLGLIGYFLLSWESLRTFVILYPEIILLCVPLNIMMGRYFGLRATEYMRFKSIIDYGNK